MRHMHTGASIQREGKGRYGKAGRQVVVSMYVQVHAHTVQVVVGSL